MIKGINSKINKKLCLEMPKEKKIWCYKQNITYKSQKASIDDLSLKSNKHWKYQIIEYIPKYKFIKAFLNTATCIYERNLSVLHTRFYYKHTTR